MSRCLLAKYVPDWLVTQELVKLWHDEDDYYNDDEFAQWHDEETTQGQESTDK